MADFTAGFTAVWTRADTAEMFGARPTRSMTLLCLALAACGGAAGGEGSREPAAMDSAPDESASADAPIDLLREGGDIMLRDDLRVLCEDMSAIRSDRSRPLPLRMRQVEEARRRSEPERYGRIDRFLESGPVEDIAALYDQAVRGAEARGVRFQCPPMAEVLRLLVAGDEDVDPGQVPTVAEDLRALCHAAGEVDPDQLPPEQVHRALAALETVVANPATLEVFEVMEGTRPTRRYLVVVEFAEAQGWTDWRCPALERLISTSL